MWTTDRKVRRDYPHPGTPDTYGTPYSAMAACVPAGSSNQEFVDALTRKPFRNGTAHRATGVLGNDGPPSGSPGAVAP